MEYRPAGSAYASQSATQSVRPAAAAGVGSTISHVGTPCAVAVGKAPSVPVGVFVVHASNTPATLRTPIASKSSVRGLITASLPPSRFALLVEFTLLYRGGSCQRHSRCPR